LDIIDERRAASLLNRIKDLQLNNTYWARECEKLHTLGWYKFGFFVACTLNLTLIIMILAFGWWLWLR